MEEKKQKAEPEGLPIHQFAEAFPPIEGAEFDELVKSIKERGLREKITTYEGKVIDGRNRQRACLVAKKKPMYREWEPPDPEGHEEQINRDLYFFVRDKNLTRRHSEPSQLAMSAAKLRELAGISVAQVAKDFDVSERSVFSAAKILSSGSPEVKVAVEQKELPVSVGAQIASLPKEEQPKAVEEAKRRPRGRPRKKPDPIFENGPDLDAPVAPEASRTVLEFEGETHTLEPIAAAEPPAAAAEPDLVYDHFPASQQSKWRTSFACLVGMVDDWLKQPAQQKTRVFSEKKQKEALASLASFHKQWSAMNPGGKWS